MGGAESSVTVSLGSCSSRSRNLEDISPGGTVIPWGLLTNDCLVSPELRRLWTVQ